MAIQEHLSYTVVPNQSCDRLQLHTVFERNAQENPYKNAISFAGEHLTYKELNEKANELAHWLISQGIKAESLVAVCVRPGFEIIVALLAIQKAGGVYLPIDPDYPKGRIQSIVEDAAIELTIAQADIIKNLGDVLIRPYTIEQTKFVSGAAIRNNPRVEIYPEDTAYIFYTSGTTGKPKGIAISYKSFAYYVLSAIDRFGMTPKDTTLTIAKYSFSISLFDLMTSVISGGRLIVLPRNEIMDYASLTNALEQATVVHIGPNLLKGLLSYIKKNYAVYDRFAGLRHVSSGGDLVPAELLEELKVIFSQAEIYVIYGCTEVACMGCSYLAPRNTSIEKSYIGKPFKDTEVILLGDRDNKVADGEIGEICFKGPGVMKGYLNRPQLNSNAFVKIGDATYFKTGDLGRIHPSGNLEYLGRQDFQIKLRGQRLELVEVESNLRQAPGIKDAVATAQKIGAGDKRLVAYITLENSANFSLEAIRAYIHHRLPDYMQPSGWIILDNMPLNENYKIARKALPPATQDNLIVTQAYVAPRNKKEQILAEIWQNILDILRVGIEDNFFNIGGDSLSAMNISMLAAEQGIEISPSAMMNTPTIAGLVEAGVGQYSEVNSTELENSSFGAIPELPPFISRFLYERDCQNPHHWNVSRILVAKKRLSFELVEKTFNYLGERHDALKLRFVLDGDRWQAHTLETSQGNLACKVVDLSHLPQKEQDLAIAEVTQAHQQQINLTNGPIACMVLFNLGHDRPQELFFVVHHFAMDVISWKIFWLEFELAYQQFEAKSKTILSTSPTSFRTWTQVLRQHANSSLVETNIQQWIEQPWSQVRALPKDLSDNPKLNTNGSASAERFALSRSQTQNLMRSGTRELDVESILIASLATALAQWQENNFVYFERLVHGRNVGLSEFELSRTMGCILSYAPTLLKINSQASTGDALLNITKQMQRLGDVGAHIDLYRYLGSNPALVSGLEQLPKAEVLFNYRGKVDDVIERSSIFDEARAISGSDHNPDGLRQYPLAIVVDIVDGQLEVRCVYSTNMHKQESIKTFGAGFLEQLVSMQGEATKISQL